ncbi:MAG: hypothetical protein JSS76_06240 [Bacteroidetes bacterium]|nr:hypothetical protein [Bacteroidota bacterium]
MIFVEKVGPRLTGSEGAAKTVVLTQQLLKMQELYRVATGCDGDALGTVAGRGGVLHTLPGSKTKFKASVGALNSSIATPKACSKTSAPVSAATSYSKRYFDFHHRARDVFENVNDRELEMSTTAMASFVLPIDRYGLNLYRDTPQCESQYLSGIFFFGYT